MYIPIYNVYSCMYIYVCVCVYVCVYIYTHMYIFIYTYIGYAVLEYNNCLKVRCSFILRKQGGTFEGGRYLGFFLPLCLPCRDSTEQTFNKHRMNDVSPLAEASLGTHPLQECDPLNV